MVLPALAIMGATVPFWIAIAVLVLTAILKPSVLKYVLGIMFLLFIAAFTNITLEAMFWIGLLIVIMWLLTKKKG